MLKRLIRFYVYSNLHISATAALFVWTSFIIIDISANPFYILFIFSGTFLIYSLHRIIGPDQMEQPLRSQRYLIFDVNKKVTYLILFMITFLAIWAMYNLIYIYRLYLLAPVIISLFYILPIFNKKRLRDFNFVKIFCIAAVWSFFYCIPLFISQFKDAIWVFAEKGLFIFALCIPFDIKDNEADRSQGLRTIGNTLELRTSLTVSGILIVLCCVLILFMHNQEIYTTLQFIAILLSYACSLLLILNSRGKKEFFFLAYLDSMIALQAALILIVV